MNVVEVDAVTKKFGETIAVDRVSFDVQQGQIVSLLGPSGCGKTTTLRLIAGFETPDRGGVRISAEDMLGKRPYERNVGLLFQDYALFPHMTVAENISFGLRHRGFDSKAIPQRVSEMMELVKLSGFETRRPDQLSGGQQQRVALARALATHPEVMLLDEPLSALDAKLREELRIELKEILSAVGSTTIVVTHDQEEAMSLSDHVIVMNRGRIEQQGTPVEIYANPKNKFVAEFIGRSNWFKGAFCADANAGFALFESIEGYKFAVPNPSDGNRDGDAYEVCVRPERIEVSSSPERMTGGVSANVNTMNGKVVDVAHLGADVHLIIALEGGRHISVVEKNLEQSDRSAGKAVQLRFASSDCIVVAAEPAR